MPKQTITLDELIAELDKLRITEDPRVKRLTEDQKQLLIAAREGPHKVPWNRLEKFWQDWFGWGSEKTLRKLYLEAKEEAE